MREFQQSRLCGKIEIVFFTFYFIVLKSLILFFCDQSLTPPRHIIGNQHCIIFFLGTFRLDSQSLWFTLFCSKYPVFFRSFLHFCIPPYWRRLFVGRFCYELRTIEPRSLERLVTVIGVLVGEARI